MPGRRGAVGANGTWTATGSSGSTLPANPSYNSRAGNTPAEYKATQSIEFLPGFESGESDAFEAFITTESTGNGGTGSSVALDGSGYRYGFNGKENDNEVEGEGNQQDYGMRIYDPRLGRFLSVDPLENEYPWNSPYSFAEGDPINFIDLDGAEKSKSELQQIDKQNNARLKVIKANARLLAISTRGAADALLSANTGTISELWGTHLSDYDSDIEREAYLRGRIAGDVTAGLQSIGEIGFGGGVALTTGAETFGVGAVAGGTVALHGLGVGVTAASDIGWALKKLFRLNIQGTVSNDATNSTNQQAQSAHQKSSEGSKSNRGSNVKDNQQKGVSREEAEKAALEGNNPNASIQGERYLRDKNGKIVKDPLTKEARRIDFAVVEKGKVKQLVETTSLTADKVAQTAKEMRIRNAGGTYIRDAKTKKLYDVSDVQTTLSRRE